MRKFKERFMEVGETDERREYNYTWKLKAQGGVGAWKNQFYLTFRLFGVSVGS